MSRRRFYTSIGLILLTAGIYLCGYYNLIVTQWFLSKDNLIGFCFAILFAFTLWVAYLISENKKLKKRLYNEMDNIERMFIDIRTEVRNFKTRNKK